jgi:hypothetical protein
MSISIDFTSKIIDFGQDMKKRGRIFRFTELKRGDMQQYFYFLTGKSKCDGYIKKGEHQEPCHAVDIDFFDDNLKYIDPDKNPQVYLEEHEFWQKEYAGQPIISWDKDHFSI